MTTYHPHYDQHQPGIVKGYERMASYHEITANVLNSYRSRIEDREARKSMEWRGWQPSYGTDKFRVDDIAILVDELDTLIEAVKTFRDRDQECERFDDDIARRERSLAAEELYDIINRLSP